MIRRDLSVGGAILLDGDIVACDEELWHADYFRFMKKVEDCTVGMANKPKEVVLVVEVDSVEVYKVTFLCQDGDLVRKREEGHCVFDDWCVDFGVCLVV